MENHLHQMWHRLSARSLSNIEAPDSRYQFRIWKFVREVGQGRMLDRRDPKKNTVDLSMSSGAALTENRGKALFTAI